MKLNVEADVGIEDIPRAIITELNNIEAEEACGRIIRFVCRQSIRDLRRFSTPIALQWLQKSQDVSQRQTCSPN